MQRCSKRKNWNRRTKCSLLFNVIKKDLAFFFRIKKRKKSPKIQQHGRVTKKNLSFVARKEIKTPRLTIVAIVIIGVASHRRCIESR